MLFLYDNTQQGNLPTITITITITTTITIMITTRTTYQHGKNLGFAAR